MASTIDSMIANGPVITDGAWGTQMQARGLEIGDSPDHWNLTNPDAVESVARAYADAGSQVILTNTFGASSIMLERHELSALAADINRAGAEISKRAAGENAAVFASIGPTGKMLMMGEVSEDAVYQSFSEQAMALAEGGADAIVIETMADLTEAKLALRAAKETGLPVVSCMVYDTGKELDHTMMGVTPEQAALELTEAGANVIGANCGQGIQGFISLCERLHVSTKLPVWIKANAGMPELIAGEAVYKTTPSEFATYIPALINAGAKFIGGCCGTSPDFIRAVRDALVE
jgi:5-methyltetrahydrofolate--homocysteine methyltransferase